MLINVDPLKEANVAEANPILRKAVRTEEQQLAFDKLICKDC